MWFSTTVCVLTSFKTNRFSSYFYNQKNGNKKGTEWLSLVFHLKQDLGGKDFDNDEEVKVAV